MKKENMAMLCDFYEFTMSNGYFKNGFYKKNVYFDVLNKNRKRWRYDDNFEYSD